MTSTGVIRPISQPLVVSFTVIVGNEFPNRIPQGLFTKEDHLLQTVLLDSADEAFRLCVQIRGSRWQFDGLNSASLKNAQTLRRVQGVSIMNQEAFSGKEAIHRIR